VGGPKIPLAGRLKNSYTVKPEGNYRSGFVPDGFMLLRGASEQFRGVGRSEEATLKVALMGGGPCTLEAPKL